MDRRGFTLLEVMMVVVVAAILFIAAMPDPGAADAQKARNWAMQLEADIAYAQSMSISNPVDPIVLRVDPVANKYWLSRSSAPSTPVANERTGASYIVTADDSGDYAGVDIVGVDFNGDDALGFDGMGVIDQDVPALVQIECGSARIEVECAATTGASSTRTAFTKVIVRDTVAAATGVTRDIGSDSRVISREIGEDVVDGAADAASGAVDNVDDLLDVLLNR